MKTGTNLHWLIILFILVLSAPVIHTENISPEPYIQASGVNLRSGPSTSASIITVLSKGQLVEIVTQQEAWIYIKLPDNQMGWIYSKYLSNNNTVSTNDSSHTLTQTDNLIKYAQSFLKCRYRYGGTSPSGFDCSGFTRYIYSQFGYALPHKASEQMTLGKQIEKASLQRGDLVFFKTLGANYINHVGIYIGEGNFIHASSGTGYVTISSLTTGYYFSRYQSARRII